MSNNPGQDDVSIGIGATLNQASVDAAKAQFKAAVDAMVKDIQETLKSGTLGNMKLPELKAIFTAEALGVDPKVIDAAFQQIEQGINSVGTAAEGMASKTTAALGDAESAANKYLAKVEEMKVAIRQYADAAGGNPKNVEDLGNAMKKLIAPADTTAWGQAVREVSGEYKAIGEAARAAQEATTSMSGKSVDVLQNMGTAVAGNTEKVTLFRQAITDFSQQSSTPLETIKQAIQNLIPAQDRTALNTAFNQLAQETKGLGTTTVTTFDSMKGKVTDYQTQVNNLKQTFTDLQKATGADLGTIGKAVIPTLPVEQQKAATQAVGELTKAEKDLQTQQENLAKNTSSLGDVFKVVFGVTIAQIATQAMQTLISTFKQAVQDGLAYIDVLFKMQVAVRAMQRNGLDISLADVNKEIDMLLVKFPIFSRQQLTEGVTNALLFTNNLKLTKEQIDQMIQSSVTLSLVMGKDVNEVMRTFALTMSSGYSEGLQRLGISINRVIIAQKALSLGFSGSYNQLTQNQIATAALALVVEQTNRMTEDAAKYQDTINGKLKEGTSAISNFTKTVGGNFGAIWAQIVFWVGEGAAALESLYKWFTTNGEKMALWIVDFGAIFSTVFNYLFSSRNGRMPSLDDFLKQLEETKKKAEEIVKRIYEPEKYSDLGDAPVANQTGVFGLSDEDYTKAEQAADDMNTKLEDLAKNGADQLAKIELDKARDLEKIDETLKRDLVQAEIDHQRAIEELNLNHQRKLDDITLKNTRARTDAQKSLADDLAKIETDNQEAIFKAKEKYQQDSLKREQDYQLRIKEMQNQYLFDIDEALRTGNAKQALQINRKLKLDFGQAEDQRNLDVTQQQSDFEATLAELEREKQIKIQQRNQEFQQKLADLALQAQQERADEAIRFQQAQVDEATRYALKKTDLAVKAQQDRVDRETQYQNQLTDLAKSQEDQYKVLADGLVKQYKLTTDMLGKYYAVYLSIYGPSGAMDKLYAYAAASAAKTGQDIAKGLGNIQMTGTYQPGWSGPGAAEGGVFIASQPMKLNVAERGAELISVTPLSYQGRNTGKLMGNLPTNSGNGQGKLDIQILLSSDLEARIVSSSVDAMSDILVSVERESR